MGARRVKRRANRCLSLTRYPGDESHGNRYSCLFAAASLAYGSGTDSVGDADCRLRCGLLGCWAM